ncbi:PEP-CTERM sorting domain-containing protein [Okeania sp. SIO1F9]|nr:PEP-CTERM sorting domain-containing protein [Okeania sp. SIO1F9]NET78412.1 PEP-CTERM sorting domain-containing protein [Okeania sp. SIO1F9]
MGEIFFQVDLIVEHDDPVATPEPTALGALLALGALGVSKKMKKK